jgi:type II secretory pathway pseudopilin PulG
MKRRTTPAFTLIELLIVIGLLGALTTLILPAFKQTRVSSFNQIVQSDLAEIRSAFQRFYRDCVPNDSDLENVRVYGIEILLQKPSECNTANPWSFDDEYDADKQKGWRGPYLEDEGERVIKPDSIGQDTTDGSAKIKVIEDPFSNSPTDGHYYRVVAPPIDGSAPPSGYVYSEMLLVCVVGSGPGEDGNPPGSGGKDQGLDFSLAVGQTLDNVDQHFDTAIRLCPWVE